MGFDVYGRNPRSKKGEYFRNNIWGWHPLWHYTCEICRSVLTDRDMDGGSTNSGHYIAKYKAKRMALLMRADLATKYIFIQERAYYDKLRPDLGKTKPCHYCNGTGSYNITVTVQNKQISKKSKCFHCHGKGHVRIKLRDKMIRFNIFNILNFIEFIEDSGGFIIY